MAALRPIPRTDKKVIDLGKFTDVGPWLEREIVGTLHDEAIDAAKVQIVRHDNNPTKIIVDRRLTINLDPSDAVNIRRWDNVVLFPKARRITFLFQESHNLYKAVAEAYRALRGLMRIRSGEGFGSVYFWLNDPAGRSAKYRSLGDLAKRLQNATEDMTVHILGPTVPYRWKLTYNPKGKQYFEPVKPSRLTPARVAISARRGKVDGRETATIKKRIYTKTGRERFMLARAIHKLVVNRVRQRHRGVYVRYRSIRSREPLGHRWGRNVPLIMIGIKRQGKYTK